MQRTNIRMLYALILAFVATSASDPVLADKPSWAGGDKHGKSQKHERDDDRDVRGRDRNHGTAHRFGEETRVAVREYYGSPSRGRCPPGLAKKNNGCLPPGQVKKWKIGRPLPREVIYYDVPQPLVVEIGIPPVGYRYVRVAGDILMIAIGTGLVMDAIEDLGR